MKIDEPLAEINNRLQKNEGLFFITPIMVTNKGEVDIIKRKKYLGIQTMGTIVLEPVYDYVELFSSQWAVVGICGRYALFNIYNKSFVSKFIYSHISIVNCIALMQHYGYPEINSLYDLTRERFIIEESYYEEYNLKNTSTEYMWARKGKFYDFIQRKTGKIISLPGVEFAYDTLFGMLAVSGAERAACFNDMGLEDPGQLRKDVMGAGGYLVLNNYTYNVQHVIDIYGNILNL